MRKLKQPRSVQVMSRSILFDHVSIQAGKALDKAKTTAAKLSAAFDKVKASHDAENLKLASDEELLQTLLTGLSSNNTNAAGGGGYMGQLAAAQQRATRAAAEEEGNSKRLGAAQAELSTLEKKRKEGEKEADKGRKDLDKAKSDVAAIQRKIDKSGWNAELEKQADEKLAGLRNKIRTLTGVRAHAPHRCPYLIPFAGS